MAAITAAPPQQLPPAATALKPKQLNHAQRVNRLPIPPERPATPEEVAAARGIEALMVDLMIQEMRKTVPENDLIPVSHAEKIYRQMLDSEYAKAMTDAGTLGVADLVLAQIKGRR
jgi:flagellar protein FlgJ